MYSFIISLGVRAHIKTVFSNLGKSKSARGSICNTRNKVLIRISNYEPIPELSKGMAVGIVGTIQFPGKYKLYIYLIIALH